MSKPEAFQDGFVLRLFRPQDEPFLRRIHARQVRQTGFSFAWPDLLGDHRYFRVFVLEREGVVEGCLVAHATTELFVIADRPRTLRALVRRRLTLEAELLRAGADELHAFVPRTMMGRMRHFLRRMGFHLSSPLCATYYRALSRDPQPNADQQEKN